ncbi:MAG: hypothetical protein KKF98_07290 [Bacteroidetes bacterium]|nr:hypothetical protein [Bacteroidota bacterium]
MKKKIYTTLIITAMLTFPLFTVGQMLGPSDPGGEPIGEDPIGGGAPIGGGSLILIGLAAAYGAKKRYEMKKEELEA